MSTSLLLRLASASAAVLAATALAGAAIAAPVPALPQGRLLGFSVYAENHAVSYVVLDTLKVHDGLVEFDTLTIWTPPLTVDGSSMQQALNSVLVDCKANTWLRQSMVVYDPQGAGYDLGPGGRAAAPDTIQPGTGLDGLAKTLCSGAEPDESSVVVGDEAAMENAAMLVRMAQ